MRGVYYLCAVKTKKNTPLMYKVLDKGTIKSVILVHLSVAKRGYASKSNLLDAFQCMLYKLKASFLWHRNEEKVKTTSLCFLCPYVKMYVFMPTHDNTND